jgi:hypothetical protein
MHIEAAGAGGTNATIAVVNVLTVHNPNTKTTGQGVGRVVRKTAFRDIAFSGAERSRQETMAEVSEQFACPAPEYARGDIFGPRIELYAVNLNLCLWPIDEVTGRCPRKAFQRSVESLTAGHRSTPSIIQGGCIK